MWLLFAPSCPLRASVQSPGATVAADVFGRFIHRRFLAPASRNTSIWCQASAPVCIGSRIAALRVQQAAKPSNLKPMLRVSFLVRRGSEWRWPAPSYLRCWKGIPKRFRFQPTQRDVGDSCLWPHLIVSAHTKMTGPRCLDCDCGAFSWCAHCANDQDKSACRPGITGLLRRYWFHVVVILVEGSGSPRSVHDVAAANCPSQRGQ